MIPDCPGLTRAPGAPVSFKDFFGNVHDLTTTPTLTYKEAAADPRLAHLGFSTVEAVSGLVAAQRLYPIFRKNPLRAYIFDPALTDFRARALAAAPVSAKKTRCA